MLNAYTLFDGLAYNTCEYFASCVVFFRASQGKNTSNEQNVRSYYMLNHRIRGLLFHYKVRVFRDILILSAQKKKKWYFGVYFLMRVSKTS